MSLKEVRLDVWTFIITVILGIPAVLEWLRVPPETLVGPFQRYFLPISSGILAGISGLLIRKAYLWNQELGDIKKSFNQLHTISHLFRNSIHQLIEKKEQAEQHGGLFKNSDQQSDEQRILNEVCTEFSELFKTLTDDTSLVCVRLVSIPNQAACFLAGHSHHALLARDVKFDVIISDHTRYEHVAKHKDATATAKTQCFFCDNVEKAMKRNGDEAYKDPNYELSPYGSTILVPVRCIHNAHLFLGFLKLQTKKPRRLNNTWHVEIMAIFADQIFAYLDASRKIRADKSGRIFPEIPISAHKADKAYKSISSGTIQSWRFPLYHGDAHIFGEDLFRTEHGQLSKPGGGISKEKKAGPI